MREVTVILYESSEGVRFVKAQSGRYIPLVDPDHINLDGRRRLSDMPKINRVIVSAMAELADHLRSQGR